MGYQHAVLTDYPVHTSNLVSGNMVDHSACGHKSKHRQTLMFGAVPASLIMDLARSDGAMYQLELDLDCPPYVFVDPRCLVDCANGYSVITGNGKKTGVMGSEDHPKFRDTRQWLAANGYIHMEKGWSNGDRVTKPFYFNNVFMDIGVQFSCAAALRHNHTELYNNGEPLNVPNYVKKESDPWLHTMWDDSLPVTEVGFPEYFDAVNDEQDDLI